MSCSVSRRQFISSAIATGSALALARQLPAIEPIQRSGQPKFKFSLAAYSYRELLTGAEPKLTVDDFIEDCAKFGCEGTELTSYYFPADADHHYFQHLKFLTFKLGLDISGTAVGNDLALPKGEKRDQQIELVKHWVDNAELMGAPVIRVFSGKQGKDQKLEDAHNLAVEGLEECCEYAGQHGVFLALENHGGLTETAEGMLKLVADVKSPWFGVNVDTGNFRSREAYDELTRIAPYALNVQIKVVMKPRDAAAEPADFSRLAGILREAGYRGYVVLEYEEKGNPRTECPKFLDQIRAAFKA